KWQHLTMVSAACSEDELTDGFMFDGSSIEGWKAINESDMVRYDLPSAELVEVPTVCASLREALDSLEADHNYLLQGDVLSPTRSKPTSNTSSRTSPDGK
ncbi:MAG: glutamine synthetase, partial [Janthinobacterium lividum]